MINSTYDASGMLRANLEILHIKSYIQFELNLAACNFIFEIEVSVKMSLVRN